MRIEPLPRMANDIRTYFATDDTEEERVQGVRSHIKAAGTHARESVASITVNGAAGLAVTCVRFKNITVPAQCLMRYLDHDRFTGGNSLPNTDALRSAEDCSFIGFSAASGSGRVMYSTSAEKCHAC